MKLRLSATILGLLLFTSVSFAQIEQFSNNAASTLASGITSGATSLTVTTGQGARFPTISGSDYFWVTLEEGSPVTAREIVKVTARTGDVFTIVRAQQGTSASAFSAGAKVEQRVTKSTLDNFFQIPEATGLFSMTVITTTGAGTYTVPAGITKILVECVGGGGGSGGAAGAASSASAASGGGGGGYARKWITTLASPYTISVGAAGGAGAAGNNAGTAGGNTTFGAGITCNGGAQGAGGGTAGTTLVFTAGGAGGTATGGDINITGRAGGVGVRQSGTVAWGGEGGSTPLGFGGQQVANTAGAAGTAGTVYGGGGAGAVAIGATNRAGATGAQGVIIVWEFK